MLVVYSLQLGGGNDSFERIPGGCRCQEASLHERALRIAIASLPFQEKALGEWDSEVIGSPLSQSVQQRQSLAVVALPAGQDAGAHQVEVEGQVLVVPARVPRLLHGIYRLLWLAIVNQDVGIARHEVQVFAACAGYHGLVRVNGCTVVVLHCLRLRQEAIHFPVGLDPDKGFQIPRGFLYVTQLGVSHGSPLQSFRAPRSCLQFLHILLSLPFHHFPLCLRQFVIEIASTTAAPKTGNQEYGHENHGAEPSCRLAEQR
mmetsp:Transcript_14999/g.45291  ORF Transcript_14999/g.45291 Transcript_14999/m.45291 type:complete len:259 (+) Transcript_14999:252-1028(+)